MKINGISISGGTGPAGAPAGLRYNVTNDPYSGISGAGTVNFDWEFDEGYPQRITGIYINNTDLTGNSVTNEIAIAGQSTSSTKGYIIIKSDDGTIFRVFTVTTAAQLSPPGYTFFSGSVNDEHLTFASTPCTLQFIRNGDKGDIGSTGSTLAIQSSNGSTTNAQLTSTQITARISSAGSYKFSGVMITLGEGTQIGMFAPDSTYFFQLCAQGLVKSAYVQQRTSTAGGKLSLGYAAASQIFFEGFFACSATGDFAVGFASSTSFQVACLQGSFCTVQKIA